jgi:hypothetical protein
VPSKKSVIFNHELFGNHLTHIHVVVISTDTDRATRCFAPKSPNSVRNRPKCGKTRLLPDSMLDHFCEEFQINFSSRKQRSEVENSTNPVTLSNRLEMKTVVDRRTADTPPSQVDQSRHAHNLVSQSLPATGFELTKF